MNAETESKRWQQDEALERFRLIAPLLDEDLDTSKRIQTREEIAAKSNRSVRTLYRYEAAYKKDGFTGLIPEERSYTARNDLPENFSELIQEAIQLRREVPTRSVNQIILILEMEGRAAPGVLKRSTVEHHLYDAGFGKKQMKK